MSVVTWIEFTKHVDNPSVAGVIETMYTEEKFFQYWGWRTIAGGALKYRTRLQLPGVSFRKVNEPFQKTHGIVQRNVEPLFPFGGDSLVDKFEVDMYGNDWRSQEDQAFALAMAVKYQQTVFYGNSPGGRAGAAFTDPDGFDGVQARVTTGQTVNGGAASGSDGSSVFAFRLSPLHCQGIQGAPLDIRDLGEQGSTDGPMLLTRIDHAASMAIFHGRAVAWGKNFNPSNPVTCAKMDELTSKIIGKPTFYCMSERSKLQLKDDARTNGYVVPSMFDRIGDMIDSWNGAPIITSEAVIDTETNG